MDEEHAAREKRTADRQAKQAAAFKRGGGDELCTTLKQQAQAEEERTQRHAAEYEATQAEKDRRDREAKIHRRRDFVAGLIAQVLRQQTASMASQQIVALQSCLAWCCGKEVGQIMAL
jgi:hypothetical protein